MDMAAQYRTTLSVPATHPALPGHFPDAPVVPGVVLLDLVLQTSETWLGRSVNVTALRHVKFHTPLLPDQSAEFTLELAANALSFHIKRGEQLIAQGAFDI
jgi:3-hydroxyacyl-[acyl-carrier-protein] dehydratase